MLDVLGSVPASEELPRVVALAQKTSEFLDLIEQTDVVRLDADRFVGKLDLSWQESRRTPKKGFSPAIFSRR
jgi:hypothetical protein